MGVSDQAFRYIWPILCAAFAFFVWKGAKTGVVSRTIQVPAFRRGEQPLGYWLSMIFSAAIVMLAGYETLNDWIFAAH